MLNIYDTRTINTKCVKDIYADFKFWCLWVVSNGKKRSYIWFFFKFWCLWVVSNGKKRSYIWFFFHQFSLVNLYLDVGGITGNSCSLLVGGTSYVLLIRSFYPHSCVILILWLLCSFQGYRGWKENLSWTIAQPRMTLGHHSVNGMYLENRLATHYFSFNFTPETLHFAQYHV